MELSTITKSFLTLMTPNPLNLFSCFPDKNVLPISVHCKNHQDSSKLLSIKYQSLFEWNGSGFLITT